VITQIFCRIFQQVNHWYCWPAQLADLHFGRLPSE
jgi:hypothetical protein